MLVLISVLLLSSCIAEDLPVSDSAEQSKENVMPDVIMAQMDSYLAAKTGDKLNFSFFAISKRKNAITSRNITQISFGCDDVVAIEYWKMMEGYEDGYHYESLWTYLIFKKEGNYVFDKVTISYKDGTSEVFPIGRCSIQVFDDDDCDVLFTYGTAQASSAVDELDCDYRKDAHHVSYAGFDLDLEAEYEVVNVTEDAYSIYIGIEFTSDKTPAYRYILPRIRVKVDGVEDYVYPKVGCSCGELVMTVKRFIDAYKAWNFN
ncbi:MAG: hypothetical protein PHI27_09410 [Eubacteriales bacterium]|nr:hypothetical protein [Eubacteriales bacterium]MDD3882458.1 hypothetical protein [Eubacteriales bacterium]MDD4513180.1 hypothetical protein [Eubacteriales bacterium]